MNRFSLRRIKRIVIYGDTGRADIDGALKVGGTVAVLLRKFGRAIGRTLLAIETTAVGCLFGRATSLGDRRPLCRRERRRIRIASHRLAVGMGLSYDGMRLKEQKV